MLNFTDEQLVQIVQIFLQVGGLAFISFWVVFSFGFGAVRAFSFDVRFLYRLIRAMKRVRKIRRIRMDNENHG